MYMYVGPIEIFSCKVIMLSLNFHIFIFLVTQFNWKYCTSFSLNIHIIFKRNPEFPKLYKNAG